MVVERLWQQELPPNVRVEDLGNGGLALLGLLEGYERIYIVDALSAGLEPGTIKRFRLSQVHVCEFRPRPMVFS